METDQPFQAAELSTALLPDVTDFFVALGLLEIGETGRPKCVSASAEAFLASLRAHFLDKNEHYFLDWSDTSYERIAARMLRKAEMYRISDSKRPHRPSRKAFRAVAVIRADFNHEPRYVMLENPKWKLGAWWFVGGGPKKRDKGDFRTTVVREACEELALMQSDLASPIYLGPARDRQISNRIGLDTDFAYEVFGLQIVGNKPELLVPEGDVQTGRRVEHFRWRSRDEILGDNHLKKYARSILGLLEKVDWSIPSSGELRKT